MKKVVYKYFLKFASETGYKLCTLEFPVGGEIVRIGQQKGNPCVWAAVDPDQKEVQKIDIEMYRTGQVMEGYREYIGTVEFFDGEEVYHFFKKPN